MYGSANHDERRWEGPEKFDVTRKLTGEHLAFGRGPHLCVGAHLARLEIRSIFEELVKRVERFELGDTERCLNNTLRGFDVCEVTFIDRNEGAVMKICSAPGSLDTGLSHAAGLIKIAACHA